MRSLKMLFPVFLSLMVTGLYAQPGKNMPAKSANKNAVKDSFAFNVLTTVDKIMRIAEDPKRHPMELAGEPLKSNYSGGMTYHSTILLAGSDAAFLLYNTWRDQQKTNWEWTTTVIDIPKGLNTAAVAGMHRKLDSLLLSFKDRGKLLGPNFQLSTWSSTRDTSSKHDMITLKISFDKGLYNTEQGAIDSIIHLYKPLLSDKRTAYDCGDKFAKALTLEGIRKEKIGEVYTSIVKDVAGIDIDAAYQLLMAPVYQIDPKDVKEQLTWSQQQAISKMAAKTIEDYNAKYNGQPKPDVVMQKKKEIEKVTPPTDPCKREIWDLRLKPGWYITDNTRVAYVIDYSCTSHTYTIAWVSDKKRLEFGRDLTTDKMAAWSFSRESPFNVCLHCHGIGYIMEYDWYQVNVASNYYARSNKQSQYTCGICKGAGYMKIR
ncbi:MAG TPA: hypothetical protein VGO58_08565 [Chitinophagaceae bacterium]|jgi:hypothetical protein|nr:hypothetical protein [Chitinophagaceae bacterium]